MAATTHLTLFIEEVFSKMPTTKTFSSIDECLDEFKSCTAEILQKKAQQKLTIEECSCCPLDVKAVTRRMAENNDGSLSISRMEDFFAEFKVTALTMTMCTEEKDKLLKLEKEKWESARKEQAEKDRKEQAEKAKNEGKGQKKSKGFFAWLKKICT